MELKAFTTLLLVSILSAPHAIASGSDDCQQKGFPHTHLPKTRNTPSSPKKFNIATLQDDHFPKLFSFLTENMNYSTQAAHAFVDEARQSHNMVHVALFNQQIVGFTWMMYFALPDVWELHAFGFAGFADPSFLQAIMDHLMSFRLKDPSARSTLIYSGDAFRMPLLELKQLLMMGFTPERKSDGAAGELLIWRGSGNTNEAPYRGASFSHRSLLAREADDLDYALLRLYLSQWYANEKDVSELVVDLRKRHSAKIDKSFILYAEGTPIGLFNVKELEQTLVLSQFVLESSNFDASEHSWAFCRVMAALISDFTKNHPRLKRVDLIFAPDRSAIFDSVLKILGVYQTATSSRIASNKQQYSFTLGK